MIFLAVYHRKRRKTSRGEVERRALICYTKADESEAIMKKIKYFAIIAASIFALTSCTDIVEVDDLKAKENKPSTGAPTVDKVVL